MWFRLDHGSAFHQKVILVGNQAWGVFCRMGAWSAANLTDGFVPKTVAKSIGKPSDFRKLSDVDLIEETDQGFIIHDYTDYNTPSENIRKNREEAKERMSRVRANKERTEPEPTANETQTFSHAPSTTSTSTSNVLTERKGSTSVEPAADGSAGQKIAPEPKAKTEPKKPKPPSQREQSAHIMVDAFAKAVNRLPKDIAGRERYDARKAFEPLVDRFDAEDIAGCTSWVRSDPFWTGKGLSALTVAKRITDWVTLGRPETFVPSSTKQTAETENEKLRRMYGIEPESNMIEAKGVAR